MLIFVNDGTFGAFTTKVKVVVFAHCPEPGVNVAVYEPGVVVVKLAGLQVPVNPSTDVVGKLGATSSLHTGAKVENVGGVVPKPTKRLIVVVLAHCPAFGVNVETFVPVVEVLNVAGFQVPAIPFVELDCNVGEGEPTQTDDNGSNVGTTPGFTTKSNVAVVPQTPASGVNVAVIVPAVAVDNVAGFHVPEIPSFDLAGNPGAVWFSQTAVNGSNVETVAGAAPTVNDIEFAQLFMSTTVT